MLATKLNWEFCGATASEEGKGSASSRDLNDLTYLLFAKGKDNVSFA